MRKAFTILELMVVLIIISVLASLSFLDLQKSVEKSRGKAAEYNLKSIYDAQKRYKLENGAYFTCSGTGDKTEEISKALFPNSINEEAYRRIDDPFFVYDIQPSETGGYVATAARTSGMCSGQLIKLTDGGGQPEKECAVWK